MHFNVRVSLSVQLTDISDIFSSTQVEFLRSALDQPEGSIQAILVPCGAVRRKPSHEVHSLLTDRTEICIFLYLSMSKLFPSFVFDDRTFSLEESWRA